MTDNALEAARAAYEIHQDTAMDQQHSSVSAYIDALEASLQAMQARAAYLEGALVPFARVAEMEKTTLDGTSVMVNVSRCRDARTALKGDNHD